MNNVVEELKKVIPLTRCKNNHKIWVSKECCFCGEKGNRVFRYNSKLKVGKFFCCGRAFKELYWLKQQLIDKDFARKFEFENRHGWYSNMTDEEYNRHKERKDKVDIINRSFVKVDYEDLDLPF